MIKVEFNRDSKKRKIQMSVKGHSGLNEKGKDIICASASILAMTAVQNITNFHHLHFIKKPKVNVEEGNITIECVCIDDDRYAFVMEMFLTIEVGYHLLATNFADYLSLKLFVSPNKG